MNQDFTGKSHIEILAAIVKNISDREEQEIARRPLAAEPDPEFNPQIFAKLLEAGARVQAAAAEAAAEAPARARQWAELMEEGARVQAAEAAAAAAVEAVRREVMHELADYLGSDPERHVRLARYIVNQPVIDLAKAGATPEEISALLTAQNEPQLAMVVATTGVLDKMGGFERAGWLAAMLPQQPGEELTLGR